MKNCYGLEGTCDRGLETSNIEQAVMQRVEATFSVSVSELKNSPTAVMERAEAEPVAVLDQNRVMAYLVPAELYEAMLDRLDDQYLADIIRARSEERGKQVDIDEL